MILLFLLPFTNAPIMFSFIISLIALILGYLLYGKFVERIFNPDPSRITPAVAHPDGVDYIPMPAWKVYMIQFLNIAGTGPIFGAMRCVSLLPCSATALPAYTFHWNCW